MTVSLKQATMTQIIEELEHRCGAEYPKITPIWVRRIPDDTIYSFREHRNKRGSYFVRRKGAAVMIEIEDRAISDIEFDYTK